MNREPSDDPPSNIIPINKAAMPIHTSEIPQIQAQLDKQEIEAQLEKLLAWQKKH